MNWSSVYRSGLLWHLAAVYFAFGFSYVIYSTFFARYLVAEAGFSLSKAGLLWMQVGMVSIISGFIWGSISDRRGRRTALVAVFVLQSLSFLLFWKQSWRDSPLPVGCLVCRDGLECAGADGRIVW